MGRQGLAISPLPPDTSHMSRAERTAVGYGSYLVNAVGSCADCHGAPPKFLAGGRRFGLGGTQAAFARNLTPDPDTGLQLTEAEFIEAMRTGRDFHPGQTKSLAVMPWPDLRWMSDADLRAIYAYLRAIPRQANAVPPDVKDDLPLPVSVPFPSEYTDGDVA